ncbi:MAG: (2Fe-2S)-binding protein, partial [Treponema sp.]|nr:(2Fe-2S)-binding protein [Treponema sp.]
VDNDLLDKREVLKSKPGYIVGTEELIPTKEWRPHFFCTEEIPCNPCTSVCPLQLIKLKDIQGSIMDMPYFEGNCWGCSACVAACPGLAISLVRKIDENWAEVRIPFEFDADSYAIGSKLPALDQAGKFVEDAELIDKRYYENKRTWTLTLKARRSNAARIIGIRVQDEAVTKPLAEAKFNYLPDDAIVCRCERITVGEIIRFIKENEIRDVNQLKSVRVGMGACGSKTCSVLLPQIFRKAGVDPASVTEGSLRPLILEVPMAEFAGFAGGQA